MTERRTILQVEHLSLWTRGERGEIPILRDLSFAIGEGERWAIAGESGAGKSMTMNAITALLPNGSTRIEGSIRFRMRNGEKRWGNGKKGNSMADPEAGKGADLSGRQDAEADGWQDLLELPYKERRRFIAGQAAIIFQDSINALNPNERIYRQWSQTVRLHRPGMSQGEMDAHLLERMETFAIPGGMGTLRQYPDQLSGGMRQRIAIAMALESQAPLLIADEPTTSLDAISQRAAVDFIRELLDRGGQTLLYISHNLGILQYMCDHVMVMYDGRIVEQGRTEDVFGQPQADYTRQLVRETMRIMGETL